MLLELFSIRIRGVRRKETIRQKRVGTAAQRGASVSISLKYKPLEGKMFCRIYIEAKNKNCTHKNISNENQ